MVNLNYKQFEINHLTSFLDDLKYEWNHQDFKFPNQQHTLEKWFTIISEEIGEIAKEILEIDNLNFDKLNHETLQAITLLIRFRYSIWQFKQTSKYHQIFK